MNRNSFLGVLAPASAGVFFWLLLVTLALPATPARAEKAVVTVPATMQPVAVPASVAAEAEGLALLRAAGEAWRTGNFRGRLVYVRGNRMDSMQVVHAVFDGVEHERISHLDDSATEIIRRGNDTVSVHSDRRMTQFEVAGAAGVFHPFAVPGIDIGRVYSVQRRGATRVAGRSAELLDIVPRDANRHGYRLCLDSVTRLPVRYEVLSRNGRTLESVEFLDIETGISVPREMFDAPGGGRSASVTRVADAPMPAVVPSWLPEGFRVTGSRAHQAGAQEPVSAVTYSDGLAAFSFFVERATAAAKPMGQQVGPTVVVSGVLDAAQAGRFLVTLVGELPAGTAVKIVESARLSAAKAKPAGAAP
jgi:sigma-E factor negative regulatory protein RseB